MPYSDGVSRRASISPTKKVIPELERLSMKLQPTPLTVLFFKDSVKTENFIGYRRHSILFTSTKNQRDELFEVLKFNDL